jgi:hypothetical protein
MNIDKLKQALRQCGGFEVVQEEVNQGRLTILGRVHPNVMDQWKIAMHRLLTEQDKAPWKVDVSKSYFLRGTKVAYGWRLIFRGVTDVAGLVSVVATTPASNRIEVKEIPLMGNHSPRVGFSDRVAVGPLALRRG